MNLRELNTATTEAARASLRECCGSAAWVDAMLVRRPFGSEIDLLRAAEEAWWRLAERDWREAFASHPQIGVRSHARPKGSSENWSQQEQSGMDGVSASTRDAMVRGNRSYFKKFGYIYIVCAAGKTCDDMFAILTERLKNDPVAEIRIAAAEQNKITSLRLKRMLRA